MNIYYFNLEWNKNKDKIYLKILKFFKIEEISQTFKFYTIFGDLKFLKNREIIIDKNNLIFKFYTYFDYWFICLNSLIYYNNTQRKNKIKKNCLRS